MLGRGVLIIGGVVLVLVGAVAAMVGFAQSLDEDNLDAQATKECTSDESLIKLTRVNPADGGIGYVYYCENSAGVQREVAPSEATFIQDFGVALGGIALGAIGIIMTTVGLVRSGTSSQPAVHQMMYTPMPMQATQLPGGGTVFTTSSVMVNGQPLVNPSEDMGQFIQQMFGAMDGMMENMMPNIQVMQGNVDVQGALQMALQQLETARANNLISPEDYEKARQKIVANLPPDPSAGQQF